MPAGDLTASQRHALDDAIRRAEQVCRFEVSVFVGSAQGDPRAYATRLHASLAEPDQSILVMVDPRRRVVEVVTGAGVRERLSDAEVELAVIAMRNDFAQHDLVGGLRRGVAMLADHARPQRTLHRAHQQDQAPQHG